jgi:hypothetical protein
VIAVQCCGTSSVHSTIRHGYALLGRRHQCVKIKVTTATHQAYQELDDDDDDDDQELGEAR